MFNLSFKYLDVVLKASMVSACLSFAKRNHKVNGEEICRIRTCAAIKKVIKDDSLAVIKNTQDWKSVRQNTEMTK